MTELNETWGGPWTQKKLKAFEDYVKAYLTIMNKYKFWKTIYFDGFAGSGERKSKTSAPLFEGLNIAEFESGVYKGAAERMVRMEPPNVFDYYYFIEKDTAASNKLEKKLSSISTFNDKKIVFRHGDCNEQLLKLASVLKNKKHAALIFLDPFGMHIEWKSISKLKDTRSDIWILIPTAVIVNRLLDKNCKLKSIKKLESFFGMDDKSIKERFYPAKEYVDLFGGQQSVYQKVLDPINKIAEVYVDNLKTLWQHVSNPLPLNNRQGAPLFHFVFASNNKNALNIAEYIIKNP